MFKHTACLNITAEYSTAGYWTGT